MIGRQAFGRRVGALAVPLLVVAAGMTVGSCGTGDPTPVAPVTQLPPSPTPTPVLAPTPTPTPASCPTLNRWSSGIHNITNSESHPADKPYVGGHVLVDSTPLFAGRACNAERDGCGGRLCEDPRGGEWQLLEGDSPSQPRGEGYQFRIGPLMEGGHRWRVCPRPDAMDAQGAPLVVLPTACTEGEFDVVPLPLG